MNIHLDKIKRLTEIVIKLIKLTLKIKTDVFIRARKQMSDDKVVVSDETKTKVAAELGLDPATQGELIDKLAHKETVNQRDLSKAIDKKAEYREAGVKAGILHAETFEPIVKTETKPLPTNTDQDLSLIREESKFYAQGGTDEELKYLNLIKGDKSLSEAKETDEFKAWNAGNESIKAKAAMELGASGKAPIGSPPREKPVGDMSRDEHVIYNNEVMKQLDNIPD